MIITAVFYTIIRILQNKQTRRFVLEGQIIGTIWTTAPAFILVFIAIPSLRLLYLMDEIHNPAITLKTVGHQRYWSYEYSDFTKLEFDSYIVQQEDYQHNTFRLLDTDNSTVLPINSRIRSPDQTTLGVAVPVLWPVPEAAVTVFSTPDDGCCDTRNM